MAVEYRLCCPHCKHVFDTRTANVCPKCGKKVEMPQGGMIKIYRMGNFFGAAGGWAIYLNGQPCGHIGNRQTVHIPLPFGAYKIHIVCGMSRNCNDPIAEITPDNPLRCYKVHIKVGAWTNDYILEECPDSEMPE